MSGNMHQGSSTISVLLLLLVCTSYSETNDAACKKKSNMMANLHMAKEAIEFAKELYPNCTDPREIPNKPGCGIKEKSFGYLEVAKNLITSSLQTVPTCPEDKEEERPDPKENILKYEKPIDCSQVLENGNTKSGVYSIWLEKEDTTRRLVKVYCDMDTDGGGWTVIQRRGNYLVQEDFYRTWNDYKKGFGNIEREFWIGNDNIYALTTQKAYSIRFDLEAEDGDKGFAVYKKFWIEDEAKNYKLHISGYSGNVGDSMFNHDQMEFSAKDKVTDQYACTMHHKGGWWYRSCFNANLNGIYRRAARNDLSTVLWVTWKGAYCLKAVEMKVKAIQ